MRQPKYKPKKLTPLEAKWEAILQKEGLGDLEHRPSGLLKSYDSFYFAGRFSKDEYREREVYYQLARDLLYQDVFANKVDKLIWELHSEGETDDEIARRMGKKASRSTVKRRISMYKKYIL